MGMFDDIRCEVPLPDGFMGNLQTKDFACEMVEHVITADGRLMLARVEYCYEIPKHERPYPNEDGLLGLAGSMGRSVSMRDSKFHGIVNFYGSEGKQEDGTYRWHEYNAKFTDGCLVQIDQLIDG